MSPQDQRHNFADQDLRNRSFQRQILNGANFSGSDLRGCSFTGAQLVGANFERARMGQTARQRTIWMGTAIATLLIVGHAISNLVAGSLGQTPSDKAWNYVVALVVSLGLGSGLAELRSRLHHPLQQWVTILSHALVGAVVGFYYAGVATNKDPRWAIVGALIGTAVAVSWAWRKSVSSAIGLRLASSLAAYGFSFLVGATALSLLNVGRLIPGGVLSVLSLLYLWLTWKGWVAVGGLIQHAPGTSFRHTNLTDAQFSQPVGQADFTGAVGHLFRSKANFQDGV